MKPAFFTFAVLFASFFVSPLRAQSSAQPARPNFLFIYTDDQRWDAMSCVQKEEGDKARFPWFQTPNMDRIAAEGVRFRNAFVVNSLCAPSRSTFLTGKYSHENGVANNHTPMPLDSVNYATILRDAGYTTAYFGKFHHDHQMERPGFDIIYSFIGQGQYQDCPVNINGTITPTKGWIDDITTDYLIDFLKDRKPDAKPFDIVLGFKSPHDPRTPADRAKDRFANETARPVPNLHVKPPFLPDNAIMAHKAEDREHRTRNEAMLDHFRCVSSADDCLGRILQTLDDLKLTENTVVIFCSDNGYYFGEHELGDKRSAYDESMRIPMLLRFPAQVKPGQILDQMVLNVDVAPTLLDFAGVPIPKDMQGLSWKPLVTTPNTPWRSAFFYEYFYETSYGQPTTTAVRTDTAKLIKYENHPEWTELFDLKNDPYEIHNLFNDPASKVLQQKMQSEYDAQAKAIDFKIPADIDKPKPGVTDHFLTDSVTPTAPPIITARTVHNKIQRILTAFPSARHT